MSFRHGHGNGHGHGKYRVLGRQSAFTLIELLVVVAIIALLISILLPSLAGARKQARAVKCAANQRQVGQAMASYLAENRSVYCPSYIYASDRSAGYDLVSQPAAPNNGYIHWSYFLYNKGQAGDEAFTCPEIRNGGTPRTNPGPDAGNWEGGQIDVNGNTQAAPSAMEDFQSRRTAFTANAAVVPRNKFTTQMSGGQRVNRLVNESELKNPGDIILLTELNKNWKASAAMSSGDSNLLSKSHRPINPFFSLSGGADEYSAALNSPTFTYTGSDSRSRPYGLLNKVELDDRVGIIDDRSIPETNAVGREHPGGDQLGGTTNFLFVDNHVERTTILKTLKDRKWGAKYYAINGNNTVIDRYGDVRN